jgi:hypothetical protein
MWAVLVASMVQNRNSQRIFFKNLKEYYFLEGLGIVGGLEIYES